ncbi:SDR family oxidoreductase [Leptospira kmetyi]|uniref:SDR family oxidoreductase n=1 Tax=Leptospira kmetyi TaxID=408139 RepID=A0AAD0XRW5_9LEPT|nr:SDR family oxidoreductase [Leptospira kmetyi]AYV57221.1 SDR family oxidoreductase [Leptospira kmetyi]
MRFVGKKVLITGASRGIGKAIADSFAKEGAWVIGTRTTDSEKGESSSNCQEWFAADFSDADQIQKCAELIRKIEPDVLINNAGINKIAPFVEIDPKDFLSIQRVNVFAPFLLCQAVLPSMIRKQWGRIVNISSIWGKISKEHRASYSASKFALDGMTISLAAEHSKNGILANCIAPGFTDTELTRRVLGEEGIRNLVAGVPSQRMGKVEEIASLVLWLSSEENSYITGQNIAIDGGFTRV